MNLDTSPDWEPATQTPPQTVRGGSLSVGLAGLFLGTPGRLRMLGALLAVGCLSFGVIGGLTCYSAAAASARAREYTAQIVRCQNIYADLLLADATAARGFLIAGAERPQDRAGYDRAIDRASDALAEALAANPADAQPLTELNVALVRYTAQIDHARAENRRGFAVAGEYQRMASQGLRDTLPVLIDVRSANEQRTRAELGWPGMQAGILLASAAVTLLVLLLASWWFAARFGRTLNQGLLGATAVILIGVVLGVGLQVSKAVSLAQFRDGTMARTTSLAEARQALYTARSLESLALIARGAGESYRTQWTREYQSVQVGLARAELPLEPLQRYGLEQQRVASLDDGGDWNGARAVFQRERQAFLTLDRQISIALSSAAEQSRQALAPSRALLVSSVLLPLLGLLAAILALRGVSWRLKDYQ